MRVIEPGHRATVGESELRYACVRCKCEFAYLSTDTHTFVHTGAKRRRVTVRCPGCELVNVISDEDLPDV